jgi:hypothetical protein
VNLELTDSEVLTLVYLLGQNLPFAQGKVQTDNEERKKIFQIILNDIESVLRKLEDG